MKKILFLSLVSFLCIPKASAMQNAALRGLILKDMSALYADYSQEHVTPEFLKHFRPAQTKPIPAVEAFKISMANNPVEKILVTDVAITSFLADAEVEYGSYFDNDQNKRIKTAELLSIQVTENTQKTGLGSVLLQYTLAVAKKRGIDFMHLNAKPFNIPTDKSYNNALADLEVFYENNGGVVTNYHEDTTDFSFNVS